MNSQTTYKRVKINWWVIILVVGIYVHIIFAYIHQWGNSPVTKPSLIFHAVILIIVLLFSGRSILEINDKFFIFRSYLWTYVKIHFKQIKDVNVVKMGLWRRMGKKREQYQFDFVKQAVSINLKNGRVYQIAIKDAEKIKEEIEKQMLKAKNQDR